MTDMDIAFALNGTDRRFAVAPEAMLVDVIRERARLTGTKVACDQAVCGTCTVLIDGQPAAACSTFAFLADGKAVTTIEGLARGNALHPVQEAFKAKSAFQCGFCTPGFVMLTAALLAEEPAPDRATIKSWLAANICRCTGYEMIVEAVEDAAARMRGEGKA